MNYYLKKKAEVLAMEDPHEALISTATDRKLAIAEIRDILESYSEAHNTTIGDMSWDEKTGEQILQPEMFQ